MTKKAMKYKRKTIKNNFFGNLVSILIGCALGIMAQLPNIIYILGRL